MSPVQADEYAGQSSVPGPRFVDRLKWLGLGVTDLDASVAFYVDKIGLTVEHSVRDVVYLAAPGSAEP